MPADTRDYLEAVKYRAGEAWGDRRLLGGPVGAIVTAVFPVPKSWSRKDRDLALRHVLRPTGKPDWDNIGKMLDALKGVVWKDDAQVVDARVLKYYGPIPFLQVEILI
jgi:Holliday junction resolvase RusA-like endonuclease